MLGGTGAIAGNVTNAGVAIKPGDAPGVLAITGDLGDDAGWIRRTWFRRLPKLAQNSGGVAFAAQRSPCPAGEGLGEGSRAKRCPTLWADPPHPAGIARHLLSEGEGKSPFGGSIS